MPSAIKTPKSKLNVAPKTDQQPASDALSQSSTSTQANVAASLVATKASRSVKPAREASKTSKKAPKPTLQGQSTESSTSEPKPESGKKSTKDVKPVKPIKSAKLIRDSFTMPADEHSQIASLKARVFALGHPVKKSELIRGGFRALSAMPADALVALLQSLPVLKLGRKKK